MTAECPLCYLARKERESYARYERIEASNQANCATCGALTFFRRGERLPDHPKRAAA